MSNDIIVNLKMKQNVSKFKKNRTISILTLLLLFIATLQEVKAQPVPVSDTIQSTVIVLDIICPATTINLLTSVTNSNLPTGTSLTWHTATPVSLANQIVAPTAVGAGTYYAAFYDTTSNCFSTNTTTVTVNTALCVENSCPSTTVNLTTAISTSNLPPGSILTWHTATPASASNQIATPTAVTAGTYYAAFYYAADNCFSSSTTTVAVSTALCLDAVCTAATANLTTALSTSNLPPGTSLTFHTNTPASSANQIVTPTAVGVGTYYAAFFDALNNCYSPTTTITILNPICPTAIISGNGGTCQETDQLTIVLTGTQPWSVDYTDGTISTTISGITASPYIFAVAPTITSTYSLVAVNDATNPGTVSGNATFSRKTWNGSVDTDWNNAANWSPNGIPIATDYVVIPSSPNNPIISGTGYNGYACVLLVKNGASLHILSSNSITVTNQVIVETTGDFQIDNNASLVQINDVDNSGIIQYKRIANVRNLDYVYWSSPVFGMNVSSLVLPLTFGPIYKWNPTVANTNGGEGNWQPATLETMIEGKGYIARAPGSFSPTVAQPLEATFYGTPNNGAITFPISRGTDTNTNYHQGFNGIEINNFSDNWNLTGNPYPSAIRASQFLLNNATKIEGNVRLWTHGTLPSTSIPSPFYATFASNYTSNDYLSYNFTGTNCCPLAPDDLFIGAGQGFFVQMKDGPAASDVITFDNTLRDATYSNSLFYRATNPLVAPTVNTIDVNTIERNRIWLDIVKDTGESDRTLFGYIQGATMDFDSFFDTHTMISGPMIVYSVQGDKKFLIQGRQLPFDDNDEVPIGVYLPNSGNYTFSIAAVDGLFSTQNIYLKDELLNVIHDIKVSPYSFSSTANTINNRFKIIYKNSTLINPDHNLDASIQIISNNHIAIKSFIEPIKEVVVYDLLGRKLLEYNQVNANQIALLNLQKTNTTLLVKVTLHNDMEVVKKVIF